MRGALAAQEGGDIIKTDTLTAECVLGKKRADGTLEPPRSGH